MGHRCSPSHSLQGLPCRTSSWLGLDTGAHTHGAQLAASFQSLGDDVNAQVPLHVLPKAFSTCISIFETLLATAQTPLPELSLQHPARTSGQPVVWQCATACLYGPSHGKYGSCPICNADPVVNSLGNVCSEQVAVVAHFTKHAVRWPHLITLSASAPWLHAIMTI